MAGRKSGTGSKVGAGRAVPGGVDREAYGEWEKRAVALARKHGKKVTKQKAIVVAVPPAGHPSGENVSLYHIGRRENDPVWYGLKSNGDFLWPATDTGGLTNLRAKPGSPPKFQGRQFGPSSAGLPVGDAYREWLRLSAKDSFPPGTRTGFGKWVRTLPEGSAIRFAKIGPEKRFVMAAAEIKKALGAYLVKTFAHGGGGAYATRVDKVSDLWFTCSVRGDPKANPNINRNNLATDFAETLETGGGGRGYANAPPGARKRDIVAAVARRGSETVITPEPKPASRKSARETPKPDGTYKKNVGGASRSIAAAATGSGIRLRPDGFQRYIYGRTVDPHTHGTYRASSVTKGGERARKVSSRVPPHISNPIHAENGYADGGTFERWGLCRDFSCMKNSVVSPNKQNTYLSKVTAYNLSLIRFNQVKTHMKLHKVTDLAILKVNDEASKKAVLDLRIQLRALDAMSQYSIMNEVTKNDLEERIKDLLKILDPKNVIELDFYPPELEDLPNVPTAEVDKQALQRIYDEEVAKLVKEFEEIGIPNNEINRYKIFEILEAEYKKPKNGFNGVPTTIFEIAGDNAIQDPFPHLRARLLILQRVRDLMKRGEANPFLNPP
jgi:hypothetical protein